MSEPMKLIQEEKDIAEGKITIDCNKSTSNDFSLLVHQKNRILFHCLYAFYSRIFHCVFFISHGKLIQIFSESFAIFLT